MTASEKLKEILSEIQKENDYDRAGLNSVIFPDKEFSEKYNVVHIHRCCEYCRYGVPSMDDGCSCLHPLRLMKYNGHWLNPLFNTSSTDVCDLWEELTEDNADIPEYNQ